LLLFAPREHYSITVFDCQSDGRNMNEEFFVSADQGGSAEEGGAEEEGGSQAAGTTHQF
jgi:hypothetical protein